MKLKFSISIFPKYKIIYLYDKIEELIKNLYNWQKNRWKKLKIYKLWYVFDEKYEIYTNEMHLKIKNINYFLSDNSCPC